MFQPRRASSSSYCEVSASADSLMRRPFLRSSGLRVAAFSVTLLLTWVLPHFLDSGSGVTGHAGDCATGTVCVSRARSGPTVSFLTRSWSPGCFAQILSVDITVLQSLKRAQLSCSFPFLRPVPGKMAFIVLVDSQGASLVCGSIPVIRSGITSWRTHFCPRGL